ncbi:endonuclease/exonuclease/phosphatase family protein [Niabella yanshanensis]|uniref:Endonuclease/exonuclease/phosphatase family protein n=1 Tax=Niabella yanshanensis TaxID=577386 RepID=A0ABZ0WAT8_9BACT|nr:endonuclease/exonuclease/phosphatase family protein [Niabella yanshanensis]WQD38672.1 endonuclease/exonuclease/phosphatase family protein [Niabella yanshanensis]
MRRFYFLFCLFLSALSTQGQDLHVMSFNIRYHNAGDSLNAWPFRKEKVVSQILYHEVHILGVQEALHDQMEDLRKELPTYKGIGTGRDGGQKAEYSALFYDTTRLELISSNTIWLSSTPYVVASKGWDAALTRVLTWGQFRDRANKRVFYAFNTHFDHVGQLARRESAHLVLKTIQEIAAGQPAILTGDFNAHPHDEPIQILTRKSHPQHLINSQDISATPHYGPMGTFNGFTNKELADTPIDFIFLKGRWKVSRHATLSPTWQGRFASDHFAVLATLEAPQAPDQ